MRYLPDQNVKNFCCLANFLYGAVCAQNLSVPAELCAHSTPDFTQISSLSYEKEPNSSTQLIKYDTSSLLRQ